MSEEVTVADMTAAYALDAVDHAKEAFQIALDFTPESVTRVEEILGQLHATMPKGFLAKLFGRGPSRDVVETMAKMYGSYVGEVIRREAGGTWSLTENGVTLTKADASVWPIAKVYKRITNGDEDNVRVYFKVLLGEYWPGNEPGESAGESA